MTEAQVETPQAEALGALVRKMPKGAMLMHAGIVPGHPWEARKKDCDPWYAHATPEGAIQAMLESGESR